jgi:ammonia channel protein AmtB
MSAVLTRRRPSRALDRDTGGVVAPQECLPQEVLFGAVASTGVAADRTTTGVTAASVRRQTLDEAMSALWDGLAAGEVAVCPACGTADMRPRHSAGAGVVGGRCSACGTTLA